MNILVCDDDREIAKAVGIYLEKEGYNVIMAYDGQEALKACRKNDIHLILMDIMMPKLDGIKATMKIREEKNIPIIMLSAKSEDYDKIMGLNVGADDYMTKPFESDELLARLRALTRRHGEIQLNEATFGDLSLNLSTGDLHCKGKSTHLNFKESEILKILMANTGGAITKDDLIVKVWGYDSDATDNNVEAYISFIRKKLNFLGSNVIITALRKMGYRLEEKE